MSALVRSLVSFGCLSLVGLVALPTAGCAADATEESASSTESELGREPAYCRSFSHLVRRYDYSTSCTYDYPEPAVQNQVSNTINNLSGAGSCVGFAVSVATLATTSVTIVLTPLAVGAAASAGASAVGCGAWIGSELARLLGGLRCTTTSTPRTTTQYSADCRVACGSFLPRVVGGDARTAECYCSVRPLACNDPAPTSTATPSPRQYPNGACTNRGNGATVAHGQCSPGYDNGQPNGRRWRCRSSAGNYSSNTWDPC